MVDSGLAHQRKDAPDAESVGDGPLRGLARTIAASVAVPVLCGLVIAAGYAATALIVKATTDPLGLTFSYGQQTALLTLLIGAVTAFAIGICVASMLIRPYSLSFILLLLLSMCCWGWANSMQHDHHKRWGTDSELWGYFPLLTISILALVVSFVVGLVGIIATVRQQALVKRSSRCG